VNKAKKNGFPRGGISVKNRIGAKKRNEKNLNDHETKYSSAFLIPFLLDTSFNDSKVAVRIENKNHITPFPSKYFYY
jgi:hypothetical protein